MAKLQSKILATASLAAAIALGGCAVSPGLKTGQKTASYTNPVYSGSMPDPTVIKHKGMYYAFGTSGPDRAPNGRIFNALKSPDLVNWTSIGGALVPPSDDRAYHYWAPDVAFDNGRFYLFYSMGRPERESFELRVASSESPEGPYVDCGRKLADCENNRFAIDPYPFKDDDGRWYLFYARNYTNSAPGVHPGTALAMDRLIDMTRLAGECKVVARARFDWTLFEANRRMDVYGGVFNWHTLEGPCVVKHDGKYYCFYSGANWQTSRYGVDYVVADNVAGPYDGQGDHARVLSGIQGKVRGPGHHSIVKGTDDKTDVIVYHAWDPGMKTRQLCIDKLDWTPDGPRCRPSYTPRPAP